MKSKRFLLLLMLAVASPWMMKAQTTVTIGDGEATHQMLPIHTYKEYSLSQQIYTAAEIGGAGTITSIALYHDNAVPPGRFEMYLVHTNKTAFNNTTDWITVEPSDMVYSIVDTPLSSGWTTFNLNEPFVYDGQRNLALIVDYAIPSLNYCNYNNWKTFEGQDNCTLYINGIGTNYDPADPVGVGYTTNFKNQLQIAIEYMPTAVDEFNADFAYYNGNEWVVKNEGDATLQVVDITGRILSSERISGCVSKTITATPGVYMLRLLNGNGVKVHKVVAKP